MSREPEENLRSDKQALAARACSLLPLLRTYVRLHSDPMLRARESCSDMVQSVLGDCIAELDGFEYRGEPSFRKWLFQKAHNKIVDRRRYWLAERRDPRREQALADGAAEPSLRASFATASEAAMRDEDLAALELCFEEISEEHRHAIVAVKLYGQSHAELAAELGRSEGAVRMLLHRAIAQLGVRLRARGL